MRVGVNLFFWHPHCGGVGNYVATLVREWPRHFPDDELVLARTDFAAPFVGALPPAPRNYRDLRLESHERIGGHLDAFDVWFCPFGHYAPRPVAKPTVLALMDIQERFFPEFFAPDDLAFRLRHYDSSLRHADRVVTISQFSRESLVRIIGLPRGKVDCIPLCADELPAPARPEALPGDWPAEFVFFPANAWAHKNHVRLLTALAQLRQRGRVVPCVLTGAPPAAGSELAAAIQAAPDGLVRHLGLVTRAEVSWLYRHARALVFPSLFEGFGIPVVEAMQCDCPVVCADTTSLPEVAGAAAEYFDPANPSAIAAAIERVWSSPARREELCGLGREQVRRFATAALVRAHRATFEKAIRSHHSRWSRLRRRWERPPVERSDRQLTEHERREAARLMRRGA